MADPIISGTQKLSISKLFASREEPPSASSFTLSAGWEGTGFCGVTVEEVTAAPAVSEPTAQVPMLHWKVVTSSNEGGKADAGLLPCKLPIVEEQKEWTAGSAKIEFTGS